VGRLEQLVGDDAQVRALGPLPLIARDLHLLLRAGADDLPVGQFPDVGLAVQDLAHAGRLPTVDRDRLPLALHLLDGRVAEALRGRDALGVQELGDADQAHAFTREPEDALNHGGLLLIGLKHRVGLDARQPLRPVAVHAARHHEALLEPLARSVADALDGLRPLDLRRDHLERAHQLLHPAVVVGARQLVAVVGAEDLHAGLVEAVQDGEGLDHLAAADPVERRHDDDVEAALPALGGGQEIEQAGPLVDGTADAVVGEHVADLPSARRGEPAADRLLHLYALDVLVALVVRLPGEDRGGGHGHVLLLNAVSLVEEGSGKRAQEARLSVADLSPRPTSIIAQSISSTRRAARAGSRRS
jgi:hypothetical protein